MKSRLPTRPHAFSLVMGMGQAKSWTHEILRRRMNQLAASVAEHYFAHRSAPAGGDPRSPQSEVNKGLARV
jgi:hypothetical protein